VDNKQLPRFFNLAAVKAVLGGDMSGFANMFDWLDDKVGQVSWMSKHELSAEARTLLEGWVKIAEAEQDEVEELRETLKAELFKLKFIKEKVLTIGSWAGGYNFRIVQGKGCATVYGKDFDGCIVAGMYRLGWLPKEEADEA
jgi:hypothetical protein